MLDNRRAPDSARGKPGTNGEPNVPIVDGALGGEKKTPPNSAGLDGGAPHAPVPESERDREIATLRQELAATRQYLQSIIEEKQTANQEALFKNQQFVEKLANTLPCLLYLYDLVEHRHLYTNGYCAAILGYPFAEAPGEQCPLVTESFHPHDLGRIRLARQRSLQARDGEVVQAEFRVRHASGDWRWFHSWDTVFARDEEGRPRQILGLAQDVTEQRYVEQEILEIIAREQRRTGQELHDTVGQELTGLGMMADALTQRLASRADGSKELAGKIRDGLERVHAQVRSLSRGLVPVQVDAEGLRAALEDLAARTSEQPGITCAFHCPQKVLVSEPDTATHLFRIAQEAVANALRHSQAHHIHIGLARDDGMVTLSVRDDGAGLPDNLERNQGLGMRLMQFRANLIGATISFGPAPGPGTLVTCSIAREKAR
jgi:PAS domain S-box-containing protein